MQMTGNFLAARRPDARSWDGRFTCSLRAGCAAVTTQWNCTRADGFALDAIRDYSPVRNFCQQRTL